MNKSIFERTMFEKMFQMIEDWIFKNECDADCEHCRYRYLNERFENHCVVDLFDEAFICNDEWPQKPPKS